MGSLQSHGIEATILDEHVKLWSCPSGTKHG